MILVTGANGFVGSRFVTKLLENGKSVRGLIRVGKQPTQQHPFLNWHTGDINDRTSLAGCMDGVDTVVHLAALLSNADEAMNQLVNAEGTRTLIQLCRLNGVKRFVLMSAAAATYKHTNAYGRSKQKAEEILRNSGLDYSILRIPLVIGRGSPEWGRFVDFIRKIPFIIPVFGSGNAIKCPIYIDDVISALTAIVEKPTSGNQVWEIACKETISLNDLIDLTCSKLNISKTKVHVPLNLSLLLASIAETLLGSRSPVTQDIICGMNEDVRFNTEIACRELELSPTPLSNAITASF
ncbi:MAG: NAD-dependent epimerase/dehydratase family protein [Alphaproteobacteria bacterium]|nr:NAD-dependent epimerase/dehydratase family protein [Alphaproteobacteria bacterium]